MVLSRNGWSEHFKSRTSCFPKRRSLSSVPHLQWWRCSTGSVVLLRERVEQDSKTGDFHIFYFQLSYPYKLWVVCAQKNEIGDPQAAEMSFLQKVSGLLVVGWRVELLLLYTERRTLWWSEDLIRMPCVCSLGVLTMSYKEEAPCRSQTHWGDYLCYLAWEHFVAPPGWQGDLNSGEWQMDEWTTKTIKLCLKQFEDFHVLENSNVLFNYFDLFTL